MKVFRIAFIVLIFILTCISSSMLITSITTIIGKGAAFGILTPDGQIYYKCDNSSATQCTIEIKPPVN